MPRIAPNSVYANGTWITYGSQPSYYNQDLAAIEADRNLVNATADVMPYDLRVIEANRELERSELKNIPHDLRAIEAQRAAIEARFGLVPGQLKELEAEQAFRKAEFEAGALDMPVFEAGRDQSKLQSQQAIEQAMANAALGLAGNQGQRLQIADEQRVSDRELRSLPPNTPAYYRGSSYSDPSVRAKQSDIAARMGMLDQRGQTLALDDARIRQNEGHTRAASAAADRMTDAQFARQQATFNTRDEELAAMEAGFDNRKAQFGIAGLELEASKAEMDARVGRIGMLQGQHDARMASLDAQEQRTRLATQQKAAQLADLDSREARARNPQYGGGGGSYGGSYGGVVQPSRLDSAWYNGSGGTHFNYDTPIYNYSTPMFNYGGGGGW